MVSYIKVKLKLFYYLNNTHISKLYTCTYMYMKGHREAGINKNLSIYLTELESYHHHQRHQRC